MSVADDLKLLQGVLDRDPHVLSRVSPDVAEAAWRRVKDAAMASKPAFPSFMGIMIAVDPTLAEGVIEFRDNTGKVLGSFKGEKL